MWYILGFAALLIVVWLFANRIFPHKITIKEGLIMLVLQSLVIAALYFGSIFGQGHDVQIINGIVVSKYQEKVSCSHSYPCNPTSVCTGSGKSRSCSTVWSTCYHHPYDYDWVVESNVGHVVIDRVDDRGKTEPLRWSEAKIGEPFSTMGMYYNYIKASPFSIFNRSLLYSEVPVPLYPSVHDYYKVNRIINYGSPFNNFGMLSERLSEHLAVLGPRKKVNALVFFHDKGQQFVDALRAKHLGGKINDVYVVVGIDAEGNFKSVEVFSWSKNSMVNVWIRDALLDLGKYDALPVADAIAAGIQQFYEHRSIKEFEYLHDHVEIPTWALWAMMLFGFCFPFTSAFIAHRYEIA